MTKWTKEVNRAFEEGIKTFRENAGGIAGAANVLAEKYLGGNLAEAMSAVNEIQKGVEEYKNKFEKVINAESEKDIADILIGDISTLEREKQIDTLVHAANVLHKYGKLEEETAENVNTICEKLNEIKAGTWQAPSLADAYITAAAERLAVITGDVAEYIIANDEAAELISKLEKENPDAEAVADAGDEAAVYSAAVMYGLYKKGVIDFAGEKVSPFQLGVEAAGRLHEAKTKIEMANDNLDEKMGMKIIKAVATAMLLVLETALVLTVITSIFGLFEAIVSTTVSAYAALLVGGAVALGVYKGFENDRNYVHAHISRFANWSRRVYVKAKEKAIALVPKIKAAWSMFAEFMTGKANSVKETVKEKIGEFNEKIEERIVNEHQKEKTITVEA